MQIWIYLIFLTWQGNLNAVSPRATHHIRRREVNLQPSTTSGTPGLTQMSAAPSKTPSMLVDAHSMATSSVPLPLTSSVPSKPSHQSEATVEANSQSQSESEAHAFVASEPRPKTETIPKTQVEPRSEGEVNPRGETTSEPKNEPEGESEPYAEPETWPEPGPQWKKAFEQWKAAWHIHVYLFASAFLAIGFYAGYYVVLNIYDGLGGKYLSVCLNAMVLLFGITRAFVLFLDPYHQGGLIKALFVMRLLWSIGGPCLTASDSLIILALVETAQVNIAPPRFQKLGTISIVCGVHFVLVIVSDTVVSIYMEAKVMILLCQIFFSLWGIVLGAGYANLAYKLDKKLFSHKQIKDTGDKIYIFLIYASAGANFFICGVMIYTMVGVFGVYADIDFVDAWHWWTLQTLFRSGEVITCVLIFTVSAKRSRVKRAMDEVSEFDSVSQTFESTSGCSAFRKLQVFFDRLRNRGRVSDIDICNEETENSVEINRSSFKRKTRNSTSDDNDTLPPAFEAFQQRGRGRRQSLFSHMQEASVQNQISVAAAATAVAPRGKRGRRQSLFSAMHEASINNAISNFAQVLTQASEEAIKCESFESEEEPSEEPKALPRRGRRTNVFSTLPETKPEKAPKRQAMMEDIKEESVYEGESESMHSRPPLLSKRSTDRIRNILSHWLSFSSRESREDIVEEEEPVEKEETSVAHSLSEETC
ncbi:uncharacterized protein LOC144635178 [Oculina patagonica]